MSEARTASISEDNPALCNILEQNIRTISALRLKAAHERSLQDRGADAITAFSGKPIFVYVHAVWFTAWILLNTGRLGVHPFDPYPYGFLTMVVSLEAIFLSTFVLISQNRLSEEADRRADLDLQIGLLTEHEITRALQMLDAIQDKLGIENDADSELADLEMETRPEDVLAEIAHINQQAPKAIPQMKGSEDSALSNLPAGFIRGASFGALAAAVEWGLKRCRSDAPRALLPSLAALLAPFNATILPVEDPEETGPVINFRITLSRPTSGGQAHRLRFAILSESRTGKPFDPGTVETHLVGWQPSTEATQLALTPQPGTGPTPSSPPLLRTAEGETKNSLIVPGSAVVVLNVDAACCLEQPWETAGRLVGQMLALAAQRTEECKPSPLDIPR